MQGSIVRWTLFVFIAFFCSSFFANAGDVWKDEQGFYYYEVPVKHVVLSDELSPAVKLHNKYPYAKLIPTDEGYEIQLLTKDLFNSIKESLALAGITKQGDFDGDGKPDLLLQTFDGLELLITKDGATLYKARDFKIGGKISKNTVFADANADGRLDMLNNTNQTVAYSQATGFTQQYSQGDYVGSLAGSHNVSPSGELSYSMPIVMAPATGGLQPQLSFEYKTNGGNGHLGKGWSLGGLRSITRCEQNLEVNGVITKLNFSDTDRFCLDGQQLIAKSGHTYGTNNSEYRLVQDSFEKITATTETGIVGPASFVVKDTNGYIYTFGKFGTESDGLLLTSTKAALVWALKKVEDASGNYYTYFYGKGDNNLEHYITSVKYTGNVGVNPNNEVTFTYDDSRPDKETSYIAGFSIPLTKRLTTVTSKINGTVLRKYNLAYDGIANKNLASVQGCDSANNCLNPTIFTWNLDIVSGEYGGTFSRESRYKGHQLLDFNGDGLLDIAYVRNDRGSSTDHLFLIKNTGAELVKVHEMNDIASKSFRATWKIVDFDKDGKDEIIYRHTDSSWYQIKQSGTSFVQTKLSIAQASSDAYSHYLDMDADGLPELLHTVGGQLSTQRGTKTGVFNAFTQVAVSLVSPGANYTVSLLPFNTDDNSLKAADFNGDGRTDFVAQVKLTYTNPDPDPCRPGRPCQIPKSVTSPQEAGYTLYPVDEASLNQVEHRVEETSFEDIQNSELLNDNSELSATESYYYWKILISQSSTAVAEYITLGSVTSIDKIIPVDINGDGLADIAYRQASNKEWFIRINNGTGFEGAISTTIKDVDTLKFYGTKTLSIAYIQGGHQFCFKNFNGSSFVASHCLGDQAGDYWSSNFIDMNGDGSPDLLDFNGRYHLKFLPGPYGERISMVTNGFGESVIVGYSNLNDPSVHQRKSDGPSKNWGNGHLVRDVKGAIPVVRSIKTSTDALSYFYTGAKMQIGRGLLGFETVQITSFAAGTRTTTTFRQDGVYRGSVAENLVEVKVNQENTGTTDPCSDNPTLCSPPKCTDYRTCYAEFGGDSDISDTTVAAQSSTAAIWRTQSKSTSTYTVRSNTSFSTNSNKTKASFVYPSSSTNVLYNTDDNSQSILSTQTQSVTSTDDFGHPLTQTESVVDAYVDAITTTTNSYIYNESNLYGGRLKKTTVTKQRTAKYAGANYPQKTITLTNSYSYDIAGRLNGTVSDSGITTTYVFDAFGLIKEEKTEATGAASRTLYRSYDLSGRYLMSETNALNQTTSYDYNSQGLKYYTQTPNGQRIYYGYNNFGRLITETTAPGNNNSITATNTLIASKTQYWCSTLVANWCPETASYYESEHQAGKPSVVSFYDKLGRIVRTASQAFDGNVWAFVDTTYDGKGRKQTETVPYYSNSTASGSNHYSYDEQGRLSGLIKPDGSEWLTSYFGFTTISTAPNGKKQTQVKNSLGELVEVTDANDKTSWYLYDANGQGTVITDPVGNKIISSYDNWGNKIQLNDPDSGITTYSYTAFHELDTQTDANGNLVDYDYDVLGRQSRILRKKPDGTVEHDVIYSYDAGAYAIGQVSSVEDIKTSYKINYYYDAFGRTRQQTTRFEDGTSYNQHWAYDNFGRLQTETDATAGGVIYNYNSNNWLSSIDDKDLTSSSGSARRYWQATAADALGNITADKLGQYISRSHSYNSKTGLIESASASAVAQGTLQNWSYKWDSLGNLEYRQDLTTSNKENFSYDALNRVETSRISSPYGATNTDIGYDVLGNITSKTGVGTYHYTTGKVHAVSAVTGVRANSYLYDKNGNMIQDNKRRFTYNSLNKPVLITQGNYQVQFHYNPMGDKYKRLEFGGKQGKLIPILVGDITTFIPLHTETRYVGNVEFIRYGGSEWVQKRYIADKAIVSKVSSQALNQSQVRYLLTDHLGSTHKITSETGVVEATMSFDVFGARRDATSWARQHEEASSGVLTSTITLRGFTGHEQLDEVGLVHMGGRVYDPILGRFLQADPFIQQPENSQNFNRYSYVLNNPLNKTDPSGYFFQMLVIWAAEYLATTYAATALGSALSYALTAYAYYNTAQFALGAAQALDGGGTAMANFAGGVAKGMAKSFAFYSIMGDPSEAATAAAGKVSSEQGATSTDGHSTDSGGSVASPLQEGDGWVEYGYDGSVTDVSGRGRVTVVHDGSLFDDNTNYSYAGGTTFEIDPMAGAITPVNLDFINPVGLVRALGVGVIKLAAKSAGQLGREGEAAASVITGVGKNTQQFTVNGRTRIPDQVNASNISTRNPLHVTEVKNVKSLSFTRQLRDNVDLVGPGGRVDVFVRPNTKLSGPLKRANADPTNPINIRPEL